MEDGDINHTEVSATLSAEINVAPETKMANYPDVEVTVIKNKTATDCKASDSCTKVNGESEKVHSDEQEEYTSDEDALIIDEECKREENRSNSATKRIRSPSPRANFKGFKKRISAQSVHFLKIVNDIKSAYCSDEKEKLSKEGKNNIIEDSLLQGELNSIASQETTAENQTESDIRTGTSSTRTLTDPKSNLSQKAPSDAHNCTDSPKHKHVTLPSVKSSAKKTVKKRPSQKLTEYAQYLGLQPAVKFKCVKCSESSFPSLSALNEHQRHCLVQPPASKPVPPPSPASVPPTPSSTNFRVTRKVFLCSSCGTYYENCNLFLHMREVHRRYICLYCLGMFSLPEKLSHHLATKHSCSPNHYSSAEDFLTSYGKSCFLVCCHCEKVFSERDNFFDHVCTEKRAALTEKTCWSCGIKGSGAHAATCRAGNEQPSTSTQSQKSTGKSATQKSSLRQSKAPKNNTKLAAAHVEHVTADSPSTSVPTPEPEPEPEPQPVPELEPELPAAEHFMAAIGTPCDVPESPAKMMSPAESDAPCPIENTKISEFPAENNLEPDSVTEKIEPEKMVTSDTEEKATEDETDEKQEENHRDNEEDNHSNHSKSRNSAEMKMETDNEEKTLPEEHSDSANEMNSEHEENHSDSDISQHENDEPDTKEGDENNVSESISENKDVSQTAADFESGNEDDDQKNNTEEDTELDNRETCVKEEEPVQETRKVPKVTLKLPPQGLVYSENESDDSEKLTMEVDEQCDSEGDFDESHENDSKAINESEKPVNGIDDNDKDNSDLNQSDEEYYQTAGEDVPIVELELDQPLDKFSIENLLKTCLGATITTCVYCNHARRIAVNGKQLGLHAIAEHRFAATVNSITAEELIPASFVTRIKESLNEVDTVYFSLEEKEKEEPAAEDPTAVSTFKRIYECFQCRYVTAIHKELYLHNRKMHAKTILLCIMCKSNFYSYSELICHLCPGNYVLHSETKFRCCMCDTNDLPSAFRLMVHLRKRHHTCDVCLEGCNNQSKLSNHVWKHKLHHLCYRCGIAYRNKPDITKHLFWKHGTESVLCKKCLQKKWPHVYHFCIPPISFVCEECSLSFSRAVYLKVHKRLHINEKPHACTEENCTETFISKKLLIKHEMKHRDPVPTEHTEPVVENKVNEPLEKENDQDTESSLDKEALSETVKQENGDKNSNSPEKEEVKPKSLLDVIDDLPALNLSESDSDDSDDEKAKVIPIAPQQQPEEEKKIEEVVPDILKTDPVTSENPAEEEQKPVPILDGIWDNFKNYQAAIEKREILTSEIINKDSTQPEKSEEDVKPEPEPLIEEVESTPDINDIMADHDYCIVSSSGPTEMETDDIETVKNEATDMDHDYCTVSTNENGIKNNQASSKLNENRPSTPENTEKKKSKTPKKKASKHNGSSSSSDSSSDSGSSSCTCGSNCSCSSSSGSSSSSSSSSDSDSSSSEGKRRIQARRERRKERAKRKKESETSHAASNTSAVDVVATEEPPVAIPVIELPIEESDLDTDETETDEDFYDEHPQRLANKIFAEKRNQLALLAAVAPVSNGTILECSRPSTPSIPEEATILKKKIKSKKRKKKSRSSTPKQEQHNIPNYHNHHISVKVQPPLPVIPVIQPPAPPPLTTHHIITSPHIPPETPRSQLLHNAGSGSETDSNVRSSKRRRVPNKFYGYSSDDETAEKPPVIPVLKWRKSDLPSTPSHVTGSPQFVPPITIKSIPSPAPVVEPVRAPVIHHSEPPESDSDVEEAPARKSESESSDSNHDDSDSDTGQLHISQPPAYPSVSAHHNAAKGMPQGQRSNVNLYCYCQCPYDEVSEMIACDGKDCAIEWFHFECVGIMVPPKGKWFCPDCRKKSTPRSDFIQT